MLSNLACYIIFNISGVLKKIKCEIIPCIPLFGRMSLICVGIYSNVFLLITFFFSLGNQVHFFDFYGRKLNTSDVGVSCIGEGTFFRKSSRG
jgi:hypothetical protein